MEIQEHRHGAVMVVKPTGSLTGSDAENLRGRLLKFIEEIHGRFVLDASAIPLVDSKGLEALVAVNDEMISTGKTMKISGANDTLRQVFRLTGLGGMFEHFEEVSAAVRSFL
jgi:anti-anti-sigma factor